jgi:multidrug resistance efflux pump
MRDGSVTTIGACPELRQALEARPPGIVHGTVLLLVGLLGAGLAWSALTEADLVVRAAGRVRPVATPKKVFIAARGEVLSASPGARVAAAYVREGDEVRRGALLIRVETEQLDAAIARERQALRAAAEELAHLDQLEGLTARQLEAARAKAEAEVAQALEEVKTARERQASDVRQAGHDLEEAGREQRQLHWLVVNRAAAPNDLFKATARLREAEEKLRKARLPVDEGRVRVARQALPLLERDYAVKRRELELKRTAKRGEIEASRSKLAGMELERKQADIRAPIDGVVTQGEVKVGDLLEPGKAVVEIAPQEGFLFEAAVPSEEVGRLEVGMAARVKLDAYDFQRYGTLGGTVCFLRQGEAGDGGPGRCRDRPGESAGAAGQADTPVHQPSLRAGGAGCEQGEVPARASWPAGERWRQRLAPAPGRSGASNGGLPWRMRRDR